MILLVSILLFHCLSAEVTTILLIDNDGGFGKAGKPAGLLTSTARTFVNEGTTTEYGTQIIGTTLENGRLYAQILQTNSRVYYGDQKYKPVKNTLDPFVRPSDPVFIFPTKVVDINANLLKPTKDNVPEELLKSTGEQLFSGQNVQFAPATPRDDEKELLENVIRARKSDVFNKRNAEGIKPSKVVSNNLPTFTVKHDFSPSGFSVSPSNNEKEEKKEDKNKPRLGKNLFVKQTPTKLDTVTYVGFADFSTTVGNTVIIFTPHTTASSAPSVEPSSSKKEEQKVMTSVKTFMSHSPGMVTKTIPGHGLSMQTALPTLVADRKSKGYNGELEVQSSFLAKEQNQFVHPTTPSLEPSIEALEPSETVLQTSSMHSSQPTEPLATYATTVTRSFNQAGVEKPLGLLQSIGGTKAYNGTTTHFTSLIYGTYIGKSYTKILQTSSNSFYVSESKGKKATIFLDAPTTTTEAEIESTGDDEEELLTTGEDIPTTEKIIETSPAAEEDVEDSIDVEPTDQVVSRLVPSTVYKTFTYLTTFFIPADKTTTTSIRSREVVSSEVTYVTKVIDESWITDSHPTIEPTEVNLIENTESIDSEFQLPVTRMLAPDTVITTTEETTSEDETKMTELTEEPTTVPLSTTTTTTSTTEEPITESTPKSTPNETKSSTTPSTTTTEEVTNSVTEESNPTTLGTNNDEDEEIEVVYKTLYTTYTYLTTFFQESTTSVSSREEVVTNIITSTLNSAITEPTTSSITPTSSVLPSADENTNGETLFTTYTYYTTLFDEGSTSVISRTEVISNIVPTPTASVLPSSILQNEDLFKSKFEMLLREQQKSAENTQSGEVISNQPINTTENTKQTTTEESVPVVTEASRINPSKVIKRTKYGTIARKLKRPLQLTPSETSDENQSQATPKLEKPGRTVVRKRIRTKSRLLPKSTTIIDEQAGVTTIHLDPTIPLDDNVRETMVTDITTSTSKGNRQVKRIAPPEPLEKIDKLDSIFDDQISSETNNEEIEPSPSPTILLQTSFTTFTYFTTVYKGSSSSDIISRLETITNVVTETVTPDPLLTPSLSPEDATLPITYFTTFTYWTTLYRDGNTVVTSREETISNIVTPSIEPTITTQSIQPTPVASTIKPTESVQTSENVPIEQPSAPSVFVPGFVPSEPTTTPEPEVPSPITSKPIEDITEPIILKNGIDDKIEPTTFYTTYTYFTTSYIGDSTVVKSRLETVTNIVNTTTPTVNDLEGNDLQTGRAINPGNSNQIEATTSSSLKTGLLSTLVSSSVNDGKTTLYSTDVFGTYIDGLYAKVLESTTKVLSESSALPTTIQQTPSQKTGIVSINEGKIVDADGISTTFFTTKAIGTSIEQLYAQVVESTSSVLVDNDKKSALESIHPGGSDIFKTGLVRLIEGSIIKDDTTTHYESRVIGTVIDGRYAQIIESTSSYKIAPTETVSSVVNPTVGVQASPVSPSNVESSMSDNDENENDDDEDNDDDDDNKGRSKSRLSFQQRKKTFTPVIRPFASRNRPTFLPKKKTVGVPSAQTVTRSNFTPTITATLATKSDGVLGASRNRFSGRRSSSTTLEIKPTISPSSKRFSGRSRSASSSVQITPTSTYSNRGRSSSRASASPSQNLSSSRGRSSFRSSASSRVLQSSELPRSSLISARPRIRPTISGLPGRGFSSTTTPQPAPEVSSESSLDEDEDDYESESENEELSSTTTTTTTTEDPNLSRRNNNPLLRLRRPPVPRVTTTTPKPDTTPTPRKGVLNNNRNKQRATTTTTTSAPTTKRTRPVNSFGNRAQLPNRPRPVNNLFPPRGLLKKPPQELDKNEGDEEDGDETDEYRDDEDDANVEESAPTKTESEKKIQNRRSDSQRRLRVRRQTEYGSRSRGSSNTNYNSRFRRPTPRNNQEDYYDDEPVVTEAPKVTPRANRGRSRQSTQVAPSTVAPRIRPSAPALQRAQFTLREKDVTTPNPRNTNFRRTQATTQRRRTNYYTTEPIPTVRKPTRLRPQTQVPSAQRRGFTSQRRPSTTRGRGRYGEDEISPLQPSFDGTITVTHKKPTEVTIPIVSGKVTEYKNVITAKPSIEVLGPHQYTVTSTNGGTLIFLNYEQTSTLNNGATEVTRFLVHETPTTSVTFTPTTIRGRKTSFAHIVPSTVYDVENLVTTLQPSLSSPLANILLSQLLLGNLNLPQNIQQPGTMPTPTTEYKTKTTTYVTSVTEQMSTIVPLTFRGKEILTTILDSSVNVITATEYVTETIVITPSVTPANQINSLLLPALLQAQLLNPPTAPAALPLPQLPQIPLNIESLNLDDKTKSNALQESEENLEEEKEEAVEQPKFKPRKKVAAEPAKEVVTLYVSGRRPGEFSTVLSTVVGGDSSVRKREALLDDIERLLVEASEVKQVRVLASQLPNLQSPAEAFEISPGMSEVFIPVSSSEIYSETESLESVVGDITLRPTEISSAPAPSASLSAAKATKKPSYLSKVPLKRDS